jgi:glycosyltransferase involved in cell wall biosynthesis
MKICFVCPCFAPAWKYGGLVKVAYELSIHLRDRGHNIKVFTTDAKDKKSRMNESFIPNINMVVYYCKNLSNYLAWNQRITISLSTIWLLKKQIKQFDIIHIHGYRDFQSVISYYYCKKYNVPYLIQPHGSVSYINKKRFKILFDKLIGKKILTNANKVITLNKSESKLIASKGVSPDRIEILPNGINLLSYYPLHKKGIFKKDLNISNDVKIILYVGRINESKGLDLLIIAVSRLLEKNKKILLIIIGEDDGFKSTLQSMIKKFNIERYVHFFGFVSYEKKLDAFADADVFVTPSFYGFPLTFLESIISGVPIITTNKGDIIEGMHNNYGLVTDYNSTALECAISKILLDDNLKEELQKNAKKESIKYDWDNIIVDLEKIYLKVVG